ncbi:MAG: YicC family protein [Betaproteobacteria bacterium]|nr:YicC family protein [Betaproteobacteria bacterium]
MSTSPSAPQRNSESSNLPCARCSPPSTPAASSVPHQPEPRYRSAVAARDQRAPARQAGRAECAVQSKLPQASTLSVSDILRWPGMFGAETLPMEELRETTLGLLSEALAEFTASRGREGENLKQLLIERADRMDQLAKDVAPKIPQLVAAQQERFAQRMREAGVTMDEERIRQEVVMYASRIDVDEELSRLHTHLGELRRILGKGGAVGKRLDFLVQELNREANTLGSKSVDVDVSQTSMELKVLIEQMREQVQNIE